jgi:SAM-dependent methyltransferase
VLYSAIIHPQHFTGETRMSLRKILKKRRKQKVVDQIERLNVCEEEIDGLDKDTRKIINLLNYTKRSTSAYDGGEFDVGYHSFNLKGKRFRGQRDPQQRFANVTYDFSGKTVLDIGCNQGGMLFEIADKIKHGVGIDYDARMVNVANRIRSYQKAPHLDFYVFDLQAERLDYISDLLTNDKVDICFLLSVCMWLKNWKDVIDFTYKSSDNLLFETNGSTEQQAEQIAYLEKIYSKVDLLSASSEDDPGQKKRKLLLCSK